MILPEPHRYFGVDSVREMCSPARQRARTVTRDIRRSIRSIRARTGLSQPAFAKRLHVSVETLRNWEQSKRHPKGPARALLRIIDKAPEAAMAALDNA